MEAVLQPVPLGPKVPKYRYDFTATNLQLIGHLHAGVIQRWIRLVSARLHVFLCRHPFPIDCLLQRDPLPLFAVWMALDIQPAKSIQDSHKGITSRHCKEVLAASQQL